MKTTPLFTAAALAALALAPAEARPPRPAQASVPFVRFGGVSNWQANDENTLYVQSNGGQWYKADMAGPCYGLDTALGIRIDTGGTDTFDNFSTVIVGHERCQVMSVTQVSGRPGGRAKNAHGD